MRQQGIPFVMHTPGCQGVHGGETHCCGISRAHGPQPGPPAATRHLSPQWCWPLSTHRGRRQGPEILQLGYDVKILRPNWGTTSRCLAPRVSRLRASGRWKAGYVAARTRSRPCQPALAQGTATALEKKLKSYQGTVKGILPQASAALGWVKSVHTVRKPPGRWPGTSLAYMGCRAPGSSLPRMCS
jgi:hypothetical protein